MIKTDYPAELKQKVITAIKCSFISCRTDEERYVVECAIVEFLTAMEFIRALDSWMRDGYSAAQIYDFAISKGEIPGVRIE
ncbi:TPA: hypothetical protein HIP81_003056 [Escherichia coli]|nr:hypothetical protein [Escherichia coli]